MQARLTLGATAKRTRCQGIYVSSPLYRPLGRPADAGRAARPGGTRQSDNLVLPTNGAVCSGHGVFGGFDCRSIEARVGGEIHLRQMGAKGEHLFCGYKGCNSKANVPSGVGRLAVIEGQRCIL